MTVDASRAALISASRARSDRSGEVALYFYCAAGFLFLNVGAQLYLVEVLAVFVAAHVVLARRSFGLPTPLVGALMLWIVAAVASDLFNETPFSDSLRGLARIVTLLFLLLALSYLIQGKSRRVVAVWLGIATSLLLSTVLTPNAYFAGEPWKFGFALPFTVLGFLAASTVARRLAIPIAFGVASMNFVQGTRSLAIVSLVAALMLIVRRRVPGSRGIVRLIVTGVFGLVLIVVVVNLYDYLALSGFFGEGRRLRAGYQSSGNLGAFVTGRGELFFSLRSIAENPLFGVGSYATPSRGVIEAQVNTLASEGYGSVAANYLREGVTSFHSELFGGVAENGIFALPFWFVVGGIFVYGLSFVAARRAVYAPLLSFVCCLGLWDLFFSPFGADRKFWLAASLVTVLVLCIRKVSREDLHHYDQLQPGPVSPASSSERTRTSRRR